MSAAAALPDGWELVKLSDVGTFKSGSGFPLNAQGKTSGRYPFFKVSDFSNDGNERSLNGANHYIDEDDRRRIGARVFPAGTIAFAKIGAAIFLERKRLVDQESCLDNNMAGYILQDGRVSRDLVLANLQQFSLGRLVASTALPAIGSGELKSISFPMPSFSAEQQAIAAALSDADGVVAGLERVIAKKRLIKQGAMQDLLTARRRLPGFSGEWEVKRLGECGQFFKGSGVRKDDAKSGELPCVRYGELYTIHHDVVRTFASHISDEVARTARLVRRGDILFEGSGETKEEIGKCAAIVHKGPIYAGGDIVVFRPTDADGVFLSYLLNGPDAQRQKASMGQGDAVVHINATALSGISIKLPCLKEQLAISEVLESMDAEIQTLSARLAKARAVKEGMMQNLLTGRVRLV